MNKVVVIGIDVAQGHLDVQISGEPAPLCAV